MRKLKVIYFAPLLAVVALFAWALASPMGAGPDDDFHLVSTWCSVVDGTNCEPGTSADTRRVPEGVLDSACFAMAPATSAACQKHLDLTGNVMVLTDRGNFVGSYPPLYYAVMHAFVGGDILASVVVMRLVNVLLFVGLTTALFWLLPFARRQTLVLMWTISTIPMGIFLIASNNPSGWAVVGVGSTWLALLGYLQTPGRRRWGLGAIAVVGTLMAAGARGDAAMYTILGIGAVLFLTFPRAKEKWAAYSRLAILPLVLVGVCFAFFALSSQSSSGIEGFSPGSSGNGTSSNGTSSNGVPESSGVDKAQNLAGFGKFAYNLLNMPFLWAGNFGEWGLGWLDTAMPSVVTFSTISCFVAIGIIGLSRLWGRKLVVVIGAGFTLWALPLYVLTKGGQVLGEAVQPRYVLPLIVLLAGLVVLTKAAKPLSLSRAQIVLIVISLSAANMVALHMNMRRYITGINHPGINLNSGIQWWWDGMPAPMTVWVVGSLAYAGLLTVMLWNVAWPSAVALGVSKFDGELAELSGPTVATVSTELTVATVSTESAELPVAIDSIRPTGSAPV